MSYAIDPRGIVYLDSKLLSLGVDYEVFKTKVQDRWSDIAQKHAARTGVDPRHILATIFAESGGNARAVSNDPGGTHGYGLMQLTSEGLKKGHSNEEILDDPDLNVALGTDYLKAIIDAQKSARDIPRINSQYNCGAPYPRENAWGLCGYPGYLDRVCATWNDQVLRTAATEASGGAGSLVKWFVGGSLLLFGAKKLFLG